MTSGKRRITVHKGSSGPGFFRRLFRGRPALVEVVPSPAIAAGSKVDFRLRHRAITRTVREFTEKIETYQLHSRRCVHVVSHFLIPGDRSLEQVVPEWIAQRVRFGIVRGGGEFEYIRVNSVDIAWDEEGTELFLHLDERVEPGTRAFVAAYLGEAEVRATPKIAGMRMGES
jgi:hypothetical protein